MRSRRRRRMRRTTTTTTTMMMMMMMMMTRRTTLRKMLTAILTDSMAVVWKEIFISQPTLAAKLCVTPQ